MSRLLNTSLVTFSLTSFVFLGGCAKILERNQGNSNNVNNGPSAALLSADVGGSFDFGTQPLGSLVEKTVTLSNTGGLTATALVPATTPLSAAIFYKGGNFPGTGGTCTATLTPGATCTLVYNFSALASMTPGGGLTLNFKIAYNDGTKNQSLGLMISGTMQSIPTSTNISGISGGMVHTCAIYKGGVFCWGYGPLGSPDLSSSPIPVAMPGLASGITAIGAGGFHNCAIQGGAVFCWGSNSSGQLGNNSTVSSGVPTPVQGLSAGATAVQGGSSHTCAIVNNGVQCWGDNTYGELGGGSVAANSLTPVAVPGLSSGVTAISARGTNTCAIVNGMVQCWGENANGQLGNGTTTAYSATPVTVTGITNASDLAVGIHHACAIASGGLFCWGDNSQGQLGDGTVNSNTVPSTIRPAGAGVTGIAAGQFHTCAVMSGMGYCWGAGAQGQLGTGTLSPSLSPTAVAGLTTISLVGVGYSHSCAPSGTGLVCWGYNADGQLGNNTSTASAFPVPVSNF